MGHLNSPLSSRGELQAKAIAERLRTEAFSQLYSSDLGRALQTAEAISSTFKIEIVKEPELRERNMGVWQGCTYKEIFEKYPLSSNFGVSFLKIKTNWAFFKGLVPIPVRSH